MKVIICPECKYQNLPDSWFCVDCGEALTIRTVIETSQVMGSHEPGTVNVRICSKCNKHNSPDAWNCVYCGKTLSINTAAEVDGSEAHDTALELLGNSKTGDQYKQTESIPTEMIKACPNCREAVMSQTWDRCIYCGGYLSTDTIIEVDASTISYENIEPEIETYDDILNSEDGESAANNGSSGWIVWIVLEVISCILCGGLAELFG